MPGLSSQVVRTIMPNLGLKEELAAKQIGSLAIDTLDVVRELLEAFEPHPHDEEAARDKATMEHLYLGKEFLSLLKFF